MKSTNIVYMINLMISIFHVLKDTLVPIVDLTVLCRQCSLIVFVNNDKIFNQEVNDYILCKHTHTVVITVQRFVCA